MGLIGLVPYFTSFFFFGDKTNSDLLIKWVLVSLVWDAFDFMGFVGLIVGFLGQGFAISPPSYELLNQYNSCILVLLCYFRYFTVLIVCTFS